MVPVLQNLTFLQFLEVPVRFIRFPTDVYITKGERAIFDCVLSKPTAKVRLCSCTEVVFGKLYRMTGTVGHAFDSELSHINNLVIGNHSFPP